MVKAIRMDEIKWVDAPAKFVKGAKIAVLLGDPANPGMLIIRFKLPANYKKKLRRTPIRNRSTSRSCREGLRIGMGTKMDMTTPVMPVGRFHAYTGEQASLRFHQAGNDHGGVGNGALRAPLHSHRRRSLRSRPTQL